MWNNKKEDHGILGSDTIRVGLSEWSKSLEGVNFDGGNTRTNEAFDQEDDESHSHLYIFVAPT
jgi:hypothetical protein